jgi:hypothetical protein
MRVLNAWPILICFMLIRLSTDAQSAAAVAIPLMDLKTPNSPCFQLLDIAPASIAHPSDPKEFAMSALSDVGSGTVLPKNFAFELAPYWYFRPRNENVYKYLNIDTNKGPTYFFTGIPRKLGISVASSFNDSTAGSLLKSTNYISLGVRTNLLTIRSSRNIDSLKMHLNNLRLRQYKYTAYGVKADSLALYVLADKKDSSALQSDLNQIPLFQLDAAFAYSDAFSSNSFSQSRFNRTAGWITATLGIPLGKRYNDELSLLGLFKLMQDNLLRDTTHNVFQQKSAVDVGGKLSYSNGNFIIGVEFVQRSYAASASLDSHRCVGMLQYQVNSTLYLTASFGQNFGNVNNLFSIIGFHFGFGNKGATLPD